MADTVIQVFEETVERWGDRPALQYKVDGMWRTTTWGEYRDRVMEVAKACIDLGVEAGKGVAILGFNRPEWFFADIGAIAAGATATGIYTTSSPEQTQYIIDHCEAALVIVEKAEYLEKLLSIRGQLPRLKTIVLMEGASDQPGVLSWAEMVERGKKVTDEELRARIDAQAKHDACTLIYTSGTTGPPKGVMLSHFNLVWVARRMCESYEFRDGESVLCYLPLSHIAEQVVSLHSPMAIGACSWFAESLEKLGENLREVRPHVFFGVPRVWEKIQARITAAGAETKGLKKRIAAWARRQGMAGGYAAQQGRPKPVLYALADRLVFSKVREKLGLDRARVCAASAAPISLHTLEFFLSLGIPILELYGMSECTGPTTFSVPTRFRTGKAGFAIEGTDLRIAEDGEVQMRGPHVFLGYFKNEAATAETLDEEGWLQSGDIGELDDEGFLRITDRKKELIITSGGKNVAPQVLESKLKAIAGIAAAVVIGDRRNYLTALFTLDPERIAQVAEGAGSPAMDASTASQCEIFRSYLENEVELVNKTLSSYETIKRFTILPGELTVEGGELTPTMKLKRRVVNERYQEEIEQLYSG